MSKRSSADAQRAAPARDPVDAVQRARIRARQRLIGAVVLLVIGVLGFPLVFETQPRPVPVDIPIDIPKKDGAPPLAMPPLARATDPAPGAPEEPVNGAPDRIITETRDDAGRDIVASGAAGLRSPDPVVSGAVPPKPAAAPVDAKAPSRPATPGGAVTDGDAARARALLEGKPAPTAAAASDAGATVPRYIVQVGAYAESGAAQSTRARLEKLGLKTYTQIANTAEGSRIRVRLGPFGTREEADRALAKARGAGLDAVLQVL